MDNDKRVLLSLTQDDVAQLTAITRIAMSGSAIPTELVLEWNNRFQRILEHMVDSVDIHFTDLGT